MNIEDYRDFCLSLGDGVEEKFPFTKFKNGEGVLVFYICGHMFSYFDCDEFTVISLKCQPERIEELKAEHDCIGDPYNEYKGKEMTFLIESLIACALFTLFVFLMSRNPIRFCHDKHFVIPGTEDMTAVQAELQLAAEGNHAVRHSEAFRSTYNPHYRIVRKHPGIAENKYLCSK